jgi:hypothetical protein
MIQINSLFLYNNERNKHSFLILIPRGKVSDTVLEDGKFENEVYIKQANKQLTQNIPGILVVLFFLEIPPSSWLLQLPGTQQIIVQNINLM